MTKPESAGKPFDISKREVWEAYQKVKENQGAPGWMGRPSTTSRTDLQKNLYKIWNRMSSGSYFPPPVRAVEIPKPHGGGTRVLGVPTVADRVAQTVVAGHLEAKVEPIFHPDSYGYRPRRSALDAVAACRQRCWKHDWVIDLDIRAFFDTVPWDLVVKAVRGTHRRPWVLLYVRRWLAAPLQQPDGTLIARHRGTPQGSAVSPVLANLFMHYAFDTWLARTHPTGGVRALRRRRCRALRQRGTGPPRAGRHRRADATGRACAASGQDPDRVLQGQQPARPVSSGPRSRSSATRSGHARRGTARDVRSWRSCPRSARKP